MSLNQFPLRRIVRSKQLYELVGYKATKLKEMEQRGEFPKSFPLSDYGHARGWWEDEVAAWQIERAKNAGQHKPKPTAASKVKSKKRKREKVK